MIHDIGDIESNVGPVRGGLGAEVAVGVYSQCEEHTEKSDFETFFRGTGACHERETGEPKRKEKVSEAVQRA